MILIQTTGKTTRTSSLPKSRTELTSRFLILPWTKMSTHKRNKQCHTCFWDEVWAGTFMSGFCPILFAISPSPRSVKNPGNRIIRIRLAILSDRIVKYFLAAELGRLKVGNEKWIFIENPRSGDPEPLLKLEYCPFTDPSCHDFVRFYLRPPRAPGVSKTPAIALLGLDWQSYQTEL